jgi:hypothetical protein
MVARRRMTMRNLVAILLLSGVAQAEEHKHPMPPPNPIMDKMKALVGSWEGTMKENGKDMPATSNFKMVSGNSVLMNTLGEGSPYEMITMIHPDQKDVMLTHYCAANNQPTMKYVAGAKANEFKFEFTSGTNIGPNDGHMQRVVYTIVDANHHFEDWTYIDQGKESTSRFDLHRKK